VAFFPAAIVQVIHVNSVKPQLFMKSSEAILVGIMQLSVAIVIENVSKHVRISIKEVFFFIIIEVELDCFAA
jgi:hypothetical protein